MRGRAAAAILLSDEEQAFPEAHLRRHKAPRSLSDRCRIVLLCAEGLASQQAGGSESRAQGTHGWDTRLANGASAAPGTGWRGGGGPVRRMPGRPSAPCEG
jgi:putative transposase